MLFGVFNMNIMQKCAARGFVRTDDSLQTGVLANEEVQAIQEG
jgi:hypothetical protein